MSEWKEYEVKTLIKKELLSIGDGYRAKNSELSDEGIPFARAGNLNGGFEFSNCDRFPTENIRKVGEKKSHVGDVVFTSKGTVGRFAFVDDKTPEFVFSLNYATGVVWMNLSSILGFYIIGCKVVLLPPKFML